MEQDQSLIPAGEAMKRLGLARPLQLKRLVDRGELTRVTFKQKRGKGFYIEKEVDDLAREWQEEIKGYIIVA